MSTLENVFRLDAIPRDSDRHLHSCPMPQCSHEFVIRRADGDSKGRTLTVAYRNLMRNEGMHRRAVKVKLPGACWCGAPLPGDVDVIFDNKVVAKNIQRAEKALASIRGESEPLEEA